MDGVLMVTNKKININRWVFQAAVIAFVVLWTMTGLEKLIGFGEFQDAIQNQTLPVGISRKLAPLIVFLELLFVPFLLFRKTQKWGLLLSILLMTVFSTYIGLVWMGAFPRVPCSCAGFIESMSWSQHLLFNLTFILLGTLGLMMKIEVES
ncbi:hypothetical protein GCM10011339_34570 [Echinicola rosea]|uniref:Methylamine utilisation protein MauE domain-containing protein n=2 Tax=Echinicola rosea TaxID=1807691 RepID=A0ABQ1VAA2_9BACT|nr:hypothetical protein GCM10011339_34570 [Echinicola rosea]